MRTHHVAYAVPDVDSAAKAFHALGYAPQGDAVDDEARMVRIRFMSDGAGELVELVEPLGEGSPVSRQVESSRGVSVPYHVCLEIDGRLEDEVARLRGAGMALLDEPSPAPAIGGRRVCFLFGRGVGLVELLEGFGHAND